jgi:hypothetical protein
MLNFEPHSPDLIVLDTQAAIWEIYFMKNDFESVIPDWI